MGTLVAQLKIMIFSALKLSKVKRKTARGLKKAISSVDSFAHSEDMENALDKLIKQIKVPFRTKATSWTKSRSRRTRVQRKMIIAGSSIGVVAVLAYLQTQLPLGSTAKVAIKGVNLATGFIST